MYTNFLKVFRVLLLGGAISMTLTSCEQKGGEAENSVDGRQETTATTNNQKMSSTSNAADSEDSCSPETPECGDNGRVFTYCFSDPVKTSGPNANQATFTYNYKWEARTCQGEQFSKFGNVDFEFTIQPGGKVPNSISSVENEPAIDANDAPFTVGKRILTPSNGVMKVINYIYPNESKADHVGLGGILVVVVTDDGSGDDKIPAPNISVTRTTGFYPTGDKGEGFADLTSSN